MLKKLLCIPLAVVGSILMGYAQTPIGTITFGTTADNTTANTTNTGFGGVRVGTGGGSFVLQNSGTEIGTDAELRGIAPSSASINSIGITSAEFGTAATTFTLSFELRLSGGSSGIWYFFAGNGTSFAATQTTGFTGAQVFTGLRWTFGASNGITTANRAGSSWADISGSPFAQNTSYHVTIVGNNSSSTVNYGNGESVAANTYDLWINGTRIDNDLTKGGLSATTNINAFRFYGESSTSNVATINLDNIVWWNTCVAPSVSSYAAFTAIPTGTYTDLYVNQNTTLSGAVSVNRNLNLISNTLTTGGNLTLKSTTSGTATVIGGTNSSISGNVTVERFLPWQSANNNGFRFVGHPFSAAPVINTVTGLPTASNTLIGYDESGTGAYVEIANRAGTWPLASSYGVWTNATNTLSMSGALQLSDLNSVSFANNGTGWNLAANPFYSVLDWDAVTRSNVQNANWIWIKDNVTQGSGTWGSYIDGVSANGGSRYLAPAQGFMIKANGTSPNISFPAAARVTGQTPTFQRTALIGEMVRVRVKRPINSSSMETVIRFRSGATNGFDSDYDAQFMSDWVAATPDIFTKDLNNISYSINAMPELNGQSQIVPLQLALESDMYTLVIDKSGLNPGTTVTIEDTKTGNFYEMLTIQDSLNFSFSTADLADRFKVHFNRSTVSTSNTASDDPIKIGTDGSKIALYGAPDASVKILDLAGKVLRQYSPIDTNQETIDTGLPTGVYLIQISSGKKIKNIKFIIR